VQQGAFSSVLHEKRDFAGYFNYYAHIEVWLYHKCIKIRDWRI